MKIKFIDWFYAILSFLPLIVTNIVLPDFPNTIPTHFSASGRVDRYGSRGELFIIAIVFCPLQCFSGCFSTISIKVPIINAVSS